MTPPLQYFGRAAPVILRKFPNIFSTRLWPFERNKPVEDQQCTLLQNNKQKFRLTIPHELEGDLNLIIFGFGKKHMIQEMYSWYALGRTVAIELLKGHQEGPKDDTESQQKGDAFENTDKLSNIYLQKYAQYSGPAVDSAGGIIMRCYTLFLFPRRYKIFNFWIKWRYKYLIKRYATNKIKAREVEKLQKLAKCSGLSDVTKFRTLKGPVPLSDDALDEFGDALDDDDREAIQEQRMQAYDRYSRVRREAVKSWEFAENVLHDTVVSYLRIQEFLNALQLPDKHRSYAAIVDREGNILWFEHGTCSISKANTVFDLFKLDSNKIYPSMLPRSISESRLYQKGETHLLDQSVRNRVPLLE